MRRYRRLVLMDRLIPFLAAILGLVALAGAVLVQASVSDRNQRLAEELAKLRLDVVYLTQRASAPAPAMDEEAIAAANGTIEALLALQERMNTLEAEWAERPAEAASSGSDFFSTSLEGTAEAIDPSWPTSNCIPMGTRFVASMGESLAICQTPVVVRLSAITDDNVMADGVGLVTETAFRSLAGTNCRLTVLEADGAGFAELRVSCN